MRTSKADIYVIAYLQYFHELLTKVKPIFTGNPLQIAVVRSLVQISIGVFFTNLTIKMPLGYSLIP